MTRLTPADRTLAASLDEDNVPRIQIARRFGVTPAAITQLLGSRRPTRATYLSTASVRTCLDCGAPILRSSKRCRPCYEGASRSCEAIAQDTADRATEEYIRVPVTALATGEIQAAGGAYANRALTWACRTPEAARVMAAVFTGRLADVPSRRAFAPMPWAVDA